MSDFDPCDRHECRIENVDFIVPERIREACTASGLDYDDAADKCGIDHSTFRTMANGHKDIPKEMVFKLIAGLNFPKEFFYQLKWERI